MQQGHGLAVLAAFRFEPAGAVCSQQRREDASVVNVLHEGADVAARKAIRHIREPIDLTPAARLSSVEPSSTEAR